MRCSPRIPTFLAVFFVLLTLSGPAQAKRFKRYPKDVKQQEDKTPKEKVPARPQAKRPADDAAKDKDEEDYAGEEAAEGGYEPEEPPGLLGYTLHGRNGLRVEYIYTGEFFNNMRGGINTRDATEYLGLFDLALTAELGEMGLMPGGTVFFLAEDSHGRGITERHVGDFQTVSNIDGGKVFTQMSEFWWERGILDGLIAVRLGKQDANAEFGIADLGGDFANSSFGMHPNIPMPAWPDPAMGVITFFQLAEWLSLKVGVFDGAADGRTWGFSGTGETFTVGQITTEWGLLDGRLPGDFHVALWYHSGLPEDPGDPNVTFVGNHGVYVCFDQLVFKESWDEEDDQGLGVFVQYGWAPKDRNELPHYIGGGLVYKGLVRCRDDDITGLGVAHAIFSDRMVGQPDETAIELFYKAQVSPYVVIQPDLQYIAGPSGQERDAFVFGLRFEVVL